MSGGIIINRSSTLLTAATDPSIYDFMCGETKAKVDEIQAKDPASRTDADCETLVHAIVEGCGC